jgi:hypothetical protein
MLMRPPRQHRPAGGARGRPGRAACIRDALTMARTLRNTLVSLRDLVASAGPIAVLAVALLVLAYLWLTPTPAAPAHAGHRARAERVRPVRTALSRGAEQRGHRGGPGAHRRLLGQPAVAESGKVDFGFVQGGSGADGPGRCDQHPVARQPVRGTGLAVLPEEAAARPRACAGQPCGTWHRACGFVRQEIPRRPGHAARPHRPAGAASERGHDWAAVYRS